MVLKPILYLPRNAEDWDSNINLLSKEQSGEMERHGYRQLERSTLRDHHVLRFGGLVVEEGLDSAVLAGAPFLKINDLSINFSTQTIYLGDCCKLHYDDNKTSKHRTTPSILRVANQSCILPGAEVRFQLPEKLLNNGPVAIEPRSTVPLDMPDWIRCDIINPDSEGYITVQNTTPEPVYLSKHTQVCQVRPTIVAKINDTSSDTNDEVPIPSISSTDDKIDDDMRSTEKKAEANSVSSKPPVSLSSIQVDPSNILSKIDQSRFRQLHKKYEEVFTGGVGCYNGYSGKFSHVINMSPDLPAQRRGRLPIYDHKNKEMLQRKLDELLEAGVLSRAEDIGVPIEYVHPVFLVKKANGDYRVVNSFGEFAEYARPQPTVSSNTEHVLLQVGQWTHLIHCDIFWSYYQVPLDPESSKYVGVMSPFKGTYVYRRSVMGLPGSEAALEELLSRIFGDLMKEGKMVKIADDFYIGANSTDSLLGTWEEVLHRLALNGLKLKAEKTICCPTSTNILGWIWNNGTISPSSHRINALTVCDPPTTVKALRSYIGCYKFISRVLPGYAEKLQPLEEACGGKESADKITWSEDLIAAFVSSKNLLKKAKPVALPRVDEQLHIVTDAAVNCAGLAATMLVNRNGKPAIVGHFNTVLRRNQARLLPCEMEALAIGVAIKHYSYYISQSQKRARVLTDSRACVLAYKKMMRGEFSASPKVTTFLALANRYNVEIMHIPGNSNAYTDFMSRNPLKCDENKCHICMFAEETSVSSVGQLNVADIVSGESRVPFATRASWLQVQLACPDLQSVHRYITTGATIQKSKKNMTDVRRYVNIGVKVSSVQGKDLLVVKQPSPFRNTVDRIVIPRHVAEGLLTALHVQLSHPSLSQLKQVFCRAYFCLDLNTKARKVCESCHTCASLKTVPNNYHKQTTSPPSKVIGSRYSADVIRRYSQYILLLREDISSYTEATLIENEKAETLRDGLTQLSSRLRSPLSPQAVIRTDPASSLRSLAIDKSLAQFNLSIEIGEPKNVNHNPIAEKAIRELEEEIVRLIPLGGKISSSLLARAVSQLNSRIRYSKLSAVEMFTSRDMATGQQLELEDKKLIADKQMIRENHHHASAKFRARGKDEVKYPPVSVGDIVYLSSDKSKLRGREKYIITKMEEDYVFVQKFTESQLRSRIYKVKKSDVIKVSSDTAEQVTELPSNPTDSIARSDNPTRSRVFYRSKPYQKHAHHHILRPPTNVNYRESSSDESDDDNSIIQIPSRFTYPNATQDNSDRDEDPDPTQDPAQDPP